MKQNLYLGFPPVKRANPIRFPLNPRAPSASRRALYKHDSVGLWGPVRQSTWLPCLSPLKLCQYLLTNGVAKNGTEISMAMLVCLISHSSPFNNNSRFEPDGLNVHIAYELRMHKYSSLYSAMQVDRDLFSRCTPHFPCRNEPLSVRKRLFFCPTPLQGSNYKTWGGTACQSPH